MKRTIKLIVTLCMVLTMLAPVSSPLYISSSVAHAATNIKLSDKKLSMEVGETYVLKLTGTKKKITWSTGDSGVATVSKSGRVTAVAAGKTKIIATVSGEKYSCTVTVIRPENPYVTNATFSAVEKTLGNVSFVIPGDWDYEDTWDGDNNYQAIISPDGLSVLNVVLKKNLNSDNLSEDLFIKHFSVLFTKEYFQLVMQDQNPETVISDFSTAEYTYTGGKAFTYTYSSAVEGQTVKQTGYVAILGKDVFMVVATGLSDDTDLITYTEYLLNSIR